MTQMHDWIVKSFGSKDGRVTPNNALYGYDLFNISEGACLVYGERHLDSINLRWGDAGRSGSIRFQRQSGTSDSVQWDEPIAIAVRKGGFLVYQRDRVGINH